MAQESFSTIERRAEFGDLKAINRVAGAYYIGDGVKQNFKTALKWALLSAGKNDAHGLFLAGRIIGRGQGVPADGAKSMELLNKAAKRKYPPAYLEMARNYFEGVGVKISNKKAVECIKHAADLDDVDAQFQIGYLYLKGQYLPQDNKLAFEYFLKAAYNNNAEAQHQVGLSFDTGKLCPQDYQQARQWYHRAAEQGHVLSMFNLAYMLVHGEGGEIDTKQAVEYYQKAADMGLDDAQFILATIYLNGDIAKKNMKNAIKYLKLAHENDHLGATAVLGSLMASGDGIKKDINKALALLKKSADAKSPIGQYHYGRILYDQGEHKQGLTYLKKAAKTHTSARLTLLKIYLATDDLPKKTKILLECQELLKDLLQTTDSELQKQLKKLQKLLNKQIINGNDKNGTKKD